MTDEKPTQHLQTILFDQATLDLIQAWGAAYLAANPGTKLTRAATIRLMLHRSAPPKAAR